MFRGSRGTTPGANRSLGGDGGISIIGPGMRFVGEIETSGVVRIEGTVQGNVRSGGDVFVAAGGTVTGDIHAHAVVTGGAVQGTVQATERAEVLAGATVHGNLAAPRVAIHEGGEVNGHLSVAPSTTPHDPAPPERRRDTPSAPRRATRTRQAVA